MYFNWDAMCSSTHQSVNLPPHRLTKLDSRHWKFAFDPGYPASPPNSLSGRWVGWKERLNASKRSAGWQGFEATGGRSKHIKGNICSIIKYYTAKKKYRCAQAGKQKCRLQKWNNKLIHVFNVTKKAIRETTKKKTIIETPLSSLPSIMVSSKVHQSPSYSKIMFYRALKCCIWARKKPFKFFWNFIGA